MAKVKLFVHAEPTLRRMVISRKNDIVNHPILNLNIIPIQEVNHHEHLGLTFNIHLNGVIILIILLRKHRIS